MPRPMLHGPEGAQRNLSPSTHVSAIIHSLSSWYQLARTDGMCPVAAAAFAAAQQHSFHPHAPRTPFEMGLHLDDSANGGSSCSCVAQHKRPQTNPNRQRTARPSTASLHAEHPSASVVGLGDTSLQAQVEREEHDAVPQPRPAPGTGTGAGAAPGTALEPETAPAPGASACTKVADHHHHADPAPSHQTHEHTHPHHPTDANATLLRKEMQNLDAEGKISLFRDKMMTRYKRSKTLELENNVRRLFEDQYKRLNRVGAIVQPPSEPESAPDQMLGCKHYARRCKLKAKCCNLFVSCRFCHDEAMLEDHEMDRFATERILCMVCLTEQDVGAVCTQCSTRFAHHFCSSCRFYENTAGKKVYHCNRCRICRLGEGLGIDNFHCDNCDACVSLQSKQHHRCMSKALHANCPVCRVYLFTSTEPVVFMRCGHTMHSKCFEEYTSGSYQCPLCMRSLTNMDKFFEQIDELVEREPMPAEYAQKRSVILCNDCERKCVTKFHFMYHKCENAECKSYNTKVLEVFDEECEEEERCGEESKAGEVEGYECLEGVGESGAFGSRLGVPAGSFGTHEMHEESGRPDEGQFGRSPLESTV